MEKVVQDMEQNVLEAIRQNCFVVTISYAVQNIGDDKKWQHHIHTQKADKDDLDHCILEIRKLAAQHNGKLHDPGKDKI